MGDPDIPGKETSIEQLAEEYVNRANLTYIHGRFPGGSSANGKKLAIIDDGEFYSFATLLPREHKVPKKVPSSIHSSGLEDVLHRLNIEDLNTVFCEIQRVNKDSQVLIEPSFGNFGEHKYMPMRSVIEQIQNTGLGQDLMEKLNDGQLDLVTLIVSAKPNKSFVSERERYLPVNFRITFVQEASQRGNLSNILRIPGGVNKLLETFYPGLFVTEGAGVILPEIEHFFIYTGEDRLTREDVIRRREVVGG